MSSKCDSPMSVVDLRCLGHHKFLHHHLIFAWFFFFFFPVWWRNWNIFHRGWISAGHGISQFRTKAVVCWKQTNTGLSIHQSSFPHHTALALTHWDRSLQNKSQIVSNWNSSWIPVCVGHLRFVFWWMVQVVAFVDFGWLFVLYCSKLTSRWLDVHIWVFCHGLHD